MTAARPPRLRVYWYSQTGQLTDAVDAFVAPLVEAGWEIRWSQVRPRTAFPFPWSLRRFVGLVPDAVHPESTVEVEVVGDDEPVDLVLFAFQVWYLAPSIPMRSVLAGPQRFAGQRVIGLTACRNMWYSAALAVSRRVTARGARYLGTVAAIDDAPPLATFFTTMRWLLTGRRDPFWFFPRAGVGPAQLARVRAVGEKLAATARPGDADFDDRVVQALAATDAAAVDPALATADLLASRVFRAWVAVARAVRPGLPRNLVLAAFAAWLVPTAALGLPAVAVARKAARRRFDAAVHRALAPAVAEVRR
ncbi:hypothetical protein GCM10011581_03060 [Saccharopolyspora subtropica]|uniref:Dialkylrecorsinol condensing enzyme n=1 Tax=Saccharopolyspora thermophila TaxID=89367 RepID=A0A917JJR0_9PSEU|nr:hypothetical protein [Saccharopolyspora subtropica]GGI69443.1 hypothetical protein GCM10011581_03060 [Saccharopolyspora subtropica]